MVGTAACSCSSVKWLMTCAIRVTCNTMLSVSCGWQGSTAAWPRHPSHIIPLEYSTIMLMCYCMQGSGGLAALKGHRCFQQINWEAVKEGRAPLPIGLREKLFKSGGGELSPWSPLPRQAGQEPPLWSKDF